MSQDYDYSKMDRVPECPGLYIDRRGREPVAVFDVGELHQYWMLEDTPETRRETMEFMRQVFWYKDPELKLIGRLPDGTEERLR